MIVFQAALLIEFLAYKILKRANSEENLENYQDIMVTFTAHETLFNYYRKF
ncbi:hypothetical protein SAMN04488522_1011369 [Pedobacter caeni]|uniref:Uncharacterized protein n=1 Tax=Pedobacter caeni TaxID=288992 RepID=A0A1M4WSP0_9SPHI|nr:hypothetical protein SAMN04488522_1011369 [Pedobacter caeni]